MTWNQALNETQKIRNHLENLLTFIEQQKLKDQIAFDTADELEAARIEFKNEIDIPDILMLEDTMGNMLDSLNEAHNMICLMSANDEM